MVKTIANDIQVQYRAKGDITTPPSQVKKGHLHAPKKLLGDLEVTTNIYCESRNLPNTDTQNYSTDLR